MIHTPRRRPARPGPAAALCALALLWLAAPAARGHFLWLSAEREASGPVVHAFLSEQPAADLPEFLRYIERATYSADGTPLDAAPGENTFLVDLPRPAPRVVDGVCSLGLMERDGVAFRLHYTARAQFAALPPEEAEAGDSLRLRWVGQEGDESKVRATFDGEPVEGATVKVHLADGTIEEIATDAEGYITVPGLAEGLTGLLARWGDGTPGEHEGRAYAETRHFATLTVPTPDVATAAAAADGGEPAGREFALLPEPLNSFGGAVVGPWLYVYSGHTGTTHRYHKGTTNPHFRRLDLRDRTTWEDLPCGPDLQGVALVAHDGALYRTGGMAAHNDEGEPHDLVSVADAARFDPESGTWTDLPPLPEPRSTHDAAVLGDHLYVVGGWAMQGGDSIDAYFHDEALRLDLTDPEAGWEPLPTPPFRRRALAVAAAGGKLYAVGGLTEADGTVCDVDVYDPAAGTWTRGPDLPGAAIQGFAPSAFCVDGRLHASGADGVVYRLSAGGDAWEAVARQAVPRITHRLLPGIDDDILIVGGNFAGLPVRFIESIPLSGDADAPRSVAWAVAAPGEAAQAQAVGVVGGRLLAVGGNRSGGPHAFEAENLVAAAFRVGPDGGPAEEFAALPAPRQSAELAVVRDGPREVAYLLGGIGHDGEVVRTLGEVLRLDPSGAGWTTLDATIPDSRGMFGATVHDGAVWVFGGSVFDPRAGHEAREMPTTVLRWAPTSEGATFEPSGHELPRPRRSHAGATVDGVHYLVGGLGPDREPVEEVDAFRFADGTWTTAPAPAHPRLFADLVELDGKLYLSGGFRRGDSGRFEPARSVEVFDPATQTWSTALEEAPIPSAEPRMMSLRGRLFFYGLDREGGVAHFALVAP